ncbi:MAG: glycosyltransferase family 39 protein [Actinobacteria bacterium]|nr:glycosyltransferase family 39 protein [Actinomycetota bacterium]
MAQTNGERTAKRAFIDRRYWLATAVVAVLVAIALSRGITRPWVGYHEAWNGAWFSLIARNYLLHGLLETKLGQVINPVPVPPEAFGYYAGHPPLLPLAVAMFFKIFGEYEWSARLVPILFSTASAPLVFLVGRELWGRRAGFIGMVAFVVNPMFLYFGRMVDHEAPVTFFALLSVLSYIRWARGDGRYLWMLSASLFLGGITDWPAYYLIPILGLHYLVFIKKKSFLAAVPLAAAIATLGLIYLQIRWLGSAAYKEIVGSFFIRTNLNSDQATTITLFKLLRAQALNANWLFTTPLLATGALGLVVASAPRYKQERSFAVSLLVGLFAFGAIHVLLFKQGAMNHSYWLYYFLPFLALSAGIALDFISSVLPKWVSPLPTFAVILAIALIARSTLTGIHQSDNWELSLFGKTAASMTKPGDVVLTSLSSRAFGTVFMMYYTRRTVVDLTDGLPKFKRALLENPTAALMVTYRNATDAELQKYLDENYRRKERGNFLFYELRKPK